MKDRLYGLLVNRVPGIRDRYSRQRLKLGKHRWIALLSLLWLNIQYYLLFRRSLALPENCCVYEHRRLPYVSAESALSYRESPEAFAARLMAYDIVSFDVFDTLLFRTCSQPTDVFFFVGATLNYPDFRHIRIRAEEEARESKREKYGTREVTLEEIWKRLERETGIPKEQGMKVEWEWEKKCCYANPYMRQVVDFLQRKGKRVIAVSDMYLGRDYLSELLQENGYDAMEDIFVSCDYGVSKSDGGLYQIVRRHLGSRLTYVHIGDHEHADYQQAQNYQIKAFLYPNVNRQGARYRPQDMSAMTGSVYRGIINARLHCGITAYSREYEYGFVYGGLFVVGYCRFIHAWRERLSLDKLLFLSRDGAVLLQAYRRMYPQEDETAVYAYWSRLAAVKLSARYYRQEFLQRFLMHKVGQQIPLAKILQSMELSDMLPSLCHQLHMQPETELTNKNVRAVQDYLIDAYEQVLAHYEDQQKAGKAYYQALLQGCKRVATVDVGWAGSGAVMLNYVLNQVWGMDCSVVGILAGTNAGRSPQTDASEAFFLSGQLVSFLFSQRENRDIWKFHDPSEGHNLYWELLLGAPDGSLIGFYPDTEGGWTYKFKPCHADTQKIQEIHRGILDFVSCFLEIEKRLGIELPVSGRDAYAPMVLASDRKNKRFMDGLEGLLDEIHIG